MIGGVRGGDRTNLHSENPHVAAAPTEEQILDAVQLTVEEWSDNALTEEEIERFRTDGYLVIETPKLGTAVVSDADAAALQDLMARGAQTTRTRFMFASSSPELSREPAALGLLSNPAVMTRASGLLASTNICCHHARLIAGSTDGSIVRDLNIEQAEGTFEQEVCGWLDRGKNTSNSPVVAVISASLL